MPRCTFFGQAISSKKSSTEQTLMGTFLCAAGLLMPIDLPEWCFFVKKTRRFFLWPWHGFQDMDSGFCVRKHRLPLFQKFRDRFLQLESRFLCRCNLKIALNQYEDSRLPYLSMNDHWKYESHSLHAIIKTSP